MKRLRRPTIIAGVCLVVVAAAVVGLVTWRHRPGHERRPCIVTDRETRALFARLTPALRGSDCAFVGLDAQPERLSLALDGAAEPLLLAHATCLAHGVAVGARYVVVTPPATAARCPVAVQRVHAALEAVGARGP